MRQRQRIDSKQQWQNELGGAEKGTRKRIHWRYKRFHEFGSGRGIFNEGRIDNKGGGQSWSIKERRWSCGQLLVLVRLLMIRLQRILWIAYFVAIFFSFYFLSVFFQFLSIFHCIFYFLFSLKIFFFLKKNSKQRLKKKMKKMARWIFGDGSFKTWYQNWCRMGDLGFWQRFGKIINKKIIQDKVHASHQANHMPTFSYRLRKDLVTTSLAKVLIGIIF